MVVPDQMLLKQTRQINVFHPHHNGRTVNVQCILPPNLLDDRHICRIASEFIDVRRQQLGVAVKFHKCYPPGASHFRRGTVGRFSCYV